ALGLPPGHGDPGPPGGSRGPDARHAAHPSKSGHVRNQSLILVTAVARKWETRMKSNPVARRFEQTFDAEIRSRFFKGLDFAGPAGDPGWFGPGSAVWHVHSHLPTLVLGLVAAAYIEGLDPSISWMGYDHSRLAERVDGVPTGNIDPEGG